MFTHLKDVKMTYFEHMKFSLFLSFTFFKAALADFVDSIYPDIRLGIKYLLTDDRYLNISMGNYHQFISTFQDQKKVPPEGGTLKINV